jgi:serine-type D-Ala-D-Ala carboxypeptidase
MISSITSHSPKDAGYDASRLDVLNAHFSEMIAKNQIQGAIYCLVRDGKVFWESAMGKYSFRVDDPRELRPEHIFRIASITKLFCAVAVFKLAEDGKLRISQPVGDFIEEFAHPPFNGIRIEHLLSHTSGLQADSGCYENPYFLSPWDCLAQGFKSGDENWIANSLKSGMRKKPGEEWAYSTFGFVILGEIISRVSGVFANDYIRDNIVKPCGLTSTCFAEDLTPDLASRIAIVNERREKLVEGILAGKDDSSEEDRKWRKIPSTGGGLYSTVGDLAEFGSMLIAGGTHKGVRILGRKAVERMTERYTTPDIKDYCWGAGGSEKQFGLGPDLRYDLNFIYSRGTFSHEGAGGCALYMDPVENFSAPWFVPFINDVWRAESIYNVTAIMWSGLL